MRLVVGPASAQRCHRVAPTQQTDLAKPVCRSGCVLQHHGHRDAVSHLHAGLGPSPVSRRCIAPQADTLESLQSVLRPLLTRDILNPSTNESWGFLHPECHGRNALVFFSWDLARAIEQQFKLHAESPAAVQLHEAQKAVDRLLNQYVQIQANPDAFEGESIELSLEHDSDDPEAAVLALKTSPKLEALILEAQEHEQAGHRPN